MDYGSLIQRAWRLTWRHRFLWVLGLFVPGTGASCSGNGGSGWGEPVGDGDDFSPDIQQAVVELGRWLDQHVWLVVLVLALVLAVVLVLVVVSFVAQGGMAQATAALAQGRAITAGEAWQSGLHLFWPFAGLWLLQLGIGLAVLLVLALPVLLLGLAAFLAGDVARVLLIILAVVVLLPLLLLAVVVFIALSIAVTFAQRAIAVDGAGPVLALRQGYELLRARLGVTALTWLLSLGISIGAAIVTALALLILLVPLGGIGVGFFVALGPAPASIGYAVGAVLVVVAVAWFLRGIISAYDWTYWTLVYLRLTGRLSERLEPALAG